MAPLSRAAFERRLRRLDGADRLAFLADLWRARGWTATVGDGQVVVASGSVRRRLVPASGAAVRVQHGEGGVDHLDAADLHAMLLYAIDREDADRLCRSHLGRSLATTDRGRLTSVDARAVLGVVAVVAVVVLVGLTAAWQGGTEGCAGTACAALTATPAGGQPGTPTASEGPAGGEGTATSGTSAADGDAAADGIPAAHAAALDGRSYTLTVTYREVVGGNVTAVRREVTRVAATPGVYVTAVEGRGRTVGEAPVVAVRPAYANGSARVERAANGTELVRPADRRAPAARMTRLLAWSLVPRNATVERGEKRGFLVYRIHATDGRWPGTANVTVLAFAESSGRVVELRRRHQVVGTDVTAVLEVEYSAVGNTTVSRPEWVGATVADPAVRPVSRRRVLEHRVGGEHRR